MQLSTEDRLLAFVYVLVEISNVKRESWKSECEMFTKRKHS